MNILHMLRLVLIAFVAAVFLLLSTLGLSMVTLSAASAVTVVSQEEGSEEPSESASTEPDPEPSDSPSPSPSPDPPPSPSPDPPPAEEPDPTTTSSNEPAPDNEEQTPASSTDPSDASLPEQGGLGSAQTSALTAAQATNLVQISLLPVIRPVLLTTQVSAAVVGLNEAFFDTATVMDPVSGLPVLFGEVTFNLFGPDDETCSGTPIGVGGDRVDSNGQVRSNSIAVITAEGAGTYRFTASFFAEDPVFQWVGSSPCNAPNESVLVLAPPDPDPDEDDDGDDGDDGDGDGKKSHRDADDKAALPNTGASDHLNLIGGTGIALTLAGLTIVAATTRRRGGAHLA